MKLTIGLTVSLFLSKIHSTLIMTEFKHQDGDSEKSQLEFSAAQFSQNPVL